MIIIILFIYLIKTLFTKKLLVIFLIKKFFCIKKYLKNCFLSITRTCITTILGSLKVIYCVPYRIIIGKNSVSVYVSAKSLVSAYSSVFNNNK